MAGTAGTVSHDLVAKLETRDERALARAMTLIERQDPLGDELLRLLRPRTGRARVVGVTGSPGSGKSTLTDALIARYRAAGESVGVVAIDPSSPFSGGAILGDRIRMMRWHEDPDVFIRSMATRGHLGGLAAATLQMVALLDAVGFDHVIVETVGVGQSEIDVVEAADTTVLVLTPGAGDGVQAFKAGIMEIADVFCVNKADMPGADRVRQDVRGALDLAMPPQDAWRQPIVATVASTGVGVDDLLVRIAAHHDYLAERGALGERLRRRVRAEVTALLGALLRDAWEERQEGAVTAILAGEATPRETVAGLWRPQ
ncbi:MAG TPA: methylmalonyl Co-A mutase-associated GTPase MeaB [Trueperaceae bacterium]|nr:methylmalonyl Co-A mutase-associated GTPase MeaB [Trueperaceae bacterium]